MSAFMRIKQQTGTSAAVVSPYTDMVRIPGGTFRGSDRQTDSISGQLLAAWAAQRFGVCQRKT
jgi:hypothetical protein